MELNNYIDSFSFLNLFNYIWQEIYFVEKIYFYFNKMKYYMN